MTPSPTKFAIALRAFFAQHLPLTRGLSPRTILSYYATRSCCCCVFSPPATLVAWLISNSSTYGREMFLQVWSTSKRSRRIASPLATRVWQPFMPLRASWRRENPNQLKSVSAFWLCPREWTSPRGRLPGRRRNTQPCSTLCRFVGTIISATEHCCSPCSTPQPRSGTTRYPAGGSSSSTGPRSVHLRGKGR